MWCSSQLHLPISERFSSHPPFHPHGHPHWLLLSQASFHTQDHCLPSAEHRNRHTAPEMLCQQYCSWLQASLLGLRGFSYKNDWAPFYSRALYICRSSFLRIWEDHVSCTLQKSKEILIQKVLRRFSGPPFVTAITAIVIKVPLRLMESAIVRSPSDSSPGSD